MNAWKMFFKVIVVAFIFASLISCANKTPAFISGTEYVVCIVGDDTTLTVFYPQTVGVGGVPWDHDKYGNRDFWKTISDPPLFPTASALASHRSAI